MSKNLMSLVAVLSFAIFYIASSKLRIPYFSSTEFTIVLLAMVTIAAPLLCRIENWLARTAASVVVGYLIALISTLIVWLMSGAFDASQGLRFAIGATTFVTKFLVAPVLTYTFLLLPASIGVASGLSRTIRFPRTRS